MTEQEGLAAGLGKSKMYLGYVACTVAKVGAGVDMEGCGAQIENM